MEIGRKPLVPYLPEGYDTHPSYQIKRAYFCTDPVVRIRQEDEDSRLTYKGKGLLSREEHNFLLTRKAYAHLPPKADGSVFTKKCYFIPLDNLDHLTTELDVFEDRYADPIPTRVGFTTEEEALSFQSSKWPGRDVTFAREYQNSRLACGW